ncbi:AMP-binding protein [candidate division KSB1 bacterium]|nr:AMP-binding protein [candidate division KSB1 bacterium]
MSQRTLCHVFHESVERFPENFFLWEKVNDSYQGTTYRQVQQSVYAVAAGLLALGIKKGDRIALISEGRNDWVIAELGILHAAAINVPLSIKLETFELKFRLAHSGTRLIFVSGAQAEKVREIKKDLADLERLIIFDTLPSLDTDEMSLQDLMLGGQEYLLQNGEAFSQYWQQISQDDAANICYTSGTTADPKGIILTHRNYTANIEQASGLLPIPESYLSLLILPWDHSFAHTAGIYTLMMNGAALASIQIGKTALETLRNIPQNIREIRPVFLLSVPSLAQNFRKNIEKGIRQKGPRVEKLFQHALKAAYCYNGLGHNRGRGWRALYKPLVWLYDRILFSKIRESFGGRLEFFIGGGALLDIELQKFFYAIGIPMFQGYGLSEAAPIISANVPKCHKLGSSGRIVSNLEVKICDEQGEKVPVGEKGEIVVQGENVMAGYWRNEKTTAETIRDGWLYTGDIGYLDHDGFLYVLGREKSLLISDDGEKFSPEGIEEALSSASHLFEQVMLYNNQSPYTSALLVPNREALLEHLKNKGLNCRSQDGQREALEILYQALEMFRKTCAEKKLFPSKWLPSTVAVLGESFTEHNHFLNSTLKMVRGKIIDAYRNRIDFLYTPEGKDFYNHQNLTIMARLEE